MPECPWYLCPNNQYDSYEELIDYVINHVHGEIHNELTDY